jgi:hypothetical protein
MRPQVAALLRRTPTLDLVRGINATHIRQATIAGRRTNREKIRNVA